MNLVSVENIIEAAKNLKGVIERTPLQKNLALSERYGCEVYLKREDLQQVRSYKIRGAYNKISSLSKEELAKGVICASAGNHAQGFAYSCHLLGVKGKVFMPSTTPKQKVNKVNFFGKEFIEAHHLTPISNLKKGETRKITSNDFAMLCSNCHRMIHRLENSGDVNKLKSILMTK